MLNFVNTILTCLSFYLLLSLPLESFTQSTQFDLKRSFDVVLDAGHGGHDVGAIGISTLEKEVTLSLALEIGNQLNRLFPFINVYYTRVDDRFIPLTERIAVANDVKADLFVSIHCNSVKIKSRAFGAETYVMGVHSTEENLDVAKRENSSILLEKNYAQNYNGYDPYSIEGHIMLSALQNQYLEESIKLAQLIQENIQKKTSLRNRGVKQAGFVLLRHATMPSVLIEAAFISDKSDEEYIVSSGGIAKTAQSIATAIGRYTQNIRKEKTNDLITSQLNTDTAPVVYKKSDNTISQIIYKIQIASSRQKIVNLTKKFGPLSNQIVEVFEDNLFKYFIGAHKSLINAVDARHKLKEEGYKGAFVVAYQNDKRIKL